MDDSSHGVIAIRAERALPSNAARGGGSQSEAWSSIRSGGRPSALHAAPNQFMSGTVRAQRAPRQEVL